MKKEIFIPYLIFSATALGCFMVLSKDENGFYVVGLSLLCFAGLFSYEMIQSIIRKKKFWQSVELFALGMMSLLLFCKVYLLLFLGIHKLYLFFGFLILACAVIRVLHVLKEIKEAGTATTYVKLSLYGLLILCILSDMYSKVANTQLTYLNMVIMVGMFISFVFVVTRIVNERASTKSNKDYLSLDVNKSFWLLFGYFLIIGNSLMLRFGYADEVDFKRRPKDYVELFYQAESGKEQPVNGKYQFQLYEEGRDQFIKRYWNK